MKITIILIIIVISFSIPLFAQEFSVDGNTVGLWHFNEGIGTIANDNSSSNNHGQINGATWTADGKFGNALSFDGNSDHIIITSPFTGIQNTFTILNYNYESLPH